MKEMIVRFESEPTDEEWRAIRTFRLRADELSKSSLVRNGYNLKANFSLTAGQPPMINVDALPAEEPFRSLLLTFRHFFAQKEPSNFLRVTKILARHIPEASDFLAQLREKWNHALFGGVMNMSISDKPLTASYILDLWLNAYYFHNDNEKAVELECLSNVLSPNFVKFLLMNAVTECCKIILQLSYALIQLTNPKAAI